MRISKKFLIDIYNQYQLLLSSDQMSKPFHKNKSGHANKADELRQQKQKKLEENNNKISKQLDKSADSWKNSMEQIRKIAKKTQDSSQILDNVFTENDIDRSELETEMQIGNNRQFADEPLFHRPIEPSYGPFRPISHHANTSSNFMNPSIPNRHFDQDYKIFNGPQPYSMEMNMNNMHGMQNLNQSNAYNYLPPPQPKYIYNDHRPQHVWNPGFNQSNTAFQTTFPNVGNYNQPFPRQYPYYPQTQYGNMVPINSNYCQPPQPPTTIYNPFMNQYRPIPRPREEPNGIESMKKYVNSLLDKLELLNDTVAKLKYENSNMNQRVRRCSQNYDSYPIPNHIYRENQTFHQSNHCCSTRRPVPQISRSCSCWDLHQVAARRPPSTISENNAYNAPYRSNHNHDEKPFNRFQHVCNSSCSSSHSVHPMISREEVLPHKHHNREYSHQPISSYKNQSPFISHASDPHFKSAFNQPRNPTTLTRNLAPVVSMVVDNCNNNSLQSVVVDSTDRATDLMSLTEMPDM